jgi:hypothetical protein
MLKFLAVLASGLLAQQLGVHGLQVNDVTRESATLTSVLKVQKASNGPAFRDLLAIGVDNHIPIGIVLGATPEAGMCEVSLGLSEGSIKVADLITAVQSKLPSYRADLQNGVLNIIPASPSTDTKSLLDMKLSEFRSSPEPHSILGTNLWMFIRAVIAPKEGTAGGGLSPTTVERVPGIDVTNQTVRSILNLIIDKGSGGVWILRSSMIKNLSPTTARPYEIYGYVGEEQFVQSIACSE